MKLTTEQLHVLQHALGVDEYGQGRQYRNYFCAGGGDVGICESLIALGLMKRHRTTEVFPDFNCSITDAGKQAMAEQSPKPPKRTRSQRRYSDFLDWADATGGTFREFLHVERKTA